MRRIVSLNREWTFYREGVKEEVNLPHTWNARDGQDGGDDYYRGSCYYEKRFRTPGLSPGEQVYLEFQGVNAAAEVTVNGFPVGKHEGGYSAFRCNITDVLKEENTLEVIADNSVNDRIYPQKADFTFYGGIYRDVNLVIVPAAHFAMEYYGGPGVKVTPLMERESGQIEGAENGRGTANGQAAVSVQVEIWVEQMHLLQAGNVLELEISDRDGRIMDARCCGIECLQEAEEGIGHLKAELDIPEPHLWQGVEDSYLYRFTARLLKGIPGTESGAGSKEAWQSVQDAVSLRFGCRSFWVDSEKGFLLNGKPYPIRGVSRHQDREGVGNALTREMHREDMELIREMGANSIRLAHYQHDQYFYDLCDEAGMVVWAEIPYITAHMDAGRENTLSQMKELVVQNHHHASICFWCVSNEVTVGGVTEAVLENNRALNALCKELDPRRLTVMACAFMLEDDSPMLRITDLVSYNHYFGWYHGELRDNDIWFDDFMRNHSGMPVGLSEYGAEAVLKWQAGKPERGDYTEQYQALYHEHMLRMIEERPWIWCTYVWNMFDFAADGRDEGGVRGRNNKGLVTFDRKEKKDAFYLYKAYWSGEPFVHIAGKRYLNRAEKLTEIIVYTNQDRVELFQNGRLAEAKSGCRVFRFQVELEKENVILVKAGKMEEGHSMEERHSMEEVHSMEDSVILHGVEKPDPSYVLPVSGDVENWFNDLLTVKEGYFSLEDRVGELVENPAGLQVFRDFMAVYDSRKKGAAAASHMTEEQRLMTMKSMRLGELMKRTNTPGDEVKQWAEKLQMIKKYSCKAAEKR